MDHILISLSGDCLELFLGFQASTCEGQPRPSWDIPGCYVCAGKCNTVYSVKCDNCDKEYVGESGRTVGIRHKEHTDGKHSSGVYDHIKATGHTCSLKNVKVISREPNYWARKYRETIHIHKRRPAMNRDNGLEIPPILLHLVDRAPRQASSNLHLKRHPVVTCDQGL